jgi:hypothetical protein
MSLILTANAENIFCFRLNFRVLTRIVDGNYPEDKNFHLQYPSTNIH